MPNGSPGVDESTTMYVPCRMTSTMFRLYTYVDATQHSLGSVGYAPVERMPRLYKLSCTSRSGELHLGETISGKSTFHTFAP